MNSKTEPIHYLKIIYRLCFFNAVLCLWFILCLEHIVQATPALGERLSITIVVILALFLLSLFATSFFTFRYFKAKASLNKT